jgi:hypothetical protein
MTDRGRTSAAAEDAIVKEIAALNKSVTRCVVQTVRVEFGPNAPGGEGFLRCSNITK